MFLEAGHPRLACLSVFRVPKQCIENITLPSTSGVAFDKTDDLQSEWPVLMGMCRAQSRNRSVFIHLFSAIQPLEHMLAIY